MLFGATSVSDVISVVDDELEMGVWLPDASVFFETTSKNRSVWLPLKLKSNDGSLARQASSFKQIEGLWRNLFLYWSLPSVWSNSEWVPDSNLMVKCGEGRSWPPCPSMPLDGIPQPRCLSESVSWKRRNNVIQHLKSSTTLFLNEWLPS